MAQEFPYFDRSLKCVVKNERERQAAMKLAGLIDARDFTGVDSVETTAQQNLKARIAQRDSYIRDPIGVAIHKIMHGYSEEATMRELEYRLLSGRKESESRG